MDGWAGGWVDGRAGRQMGEQAGGWVGDWVLWGKEPKVNELRLPQDLGRPVATSPMLGVASLVACESVCKGSGL